MATKLSNAMQRELYLVHVGGGAATVFHDGGGLPMYRALEQRGLVAENASQPNPSKWIDFTLTNKGRALAGSIAANRERDNGVTRAGAALPARPFAQLFTV